MAAKRLIALRHEDGFDYVHFTGNGDNALVMLDANYSTESAARDLVSGGNIDAGLAVFAANDLQADGSRSTPFTTPFMMASGHAADFEELLQTMRIDEHAISIFDPSGRIEEDLDAYNEQAIYGAKMHLQNADSSGPWFHIADGNAPFIGQSKKAA
jgi:hypothetical protein